MTLVNETDSQADLMLKEARINLAALQRYATRMAECPEGHVYLRLLNETAANALDYAVSHCSPVPATPPSAGTGIPAGAGASPPAPPAGTTRYVSEAGAFRERAVNCRFCWITTWSIDGICETCAR